MSDDGGFDVMETVVDAAIDSVIDGVAEDIEASEMGQTFSC